VPTHLLARAVKPRLKFDFLPVDAYGCGSANDNLLIVVAIHHRSFEHRSPSYREPPDPDTHPPIRGLIFCIIPIV
jgi:hypothetical protein